MQPSLSNVRRRSFRDRGASAHGRLLTALAILAFSAQGFALMGAAAVPPSPVPPAPSTTGFTLTAPDFSPTNAVPLSGTKDAGSSVTVAPLVSGGQPLCVITADPRTDWNCTSRIPNGANQTISAAQTLDGVTSPEQQAAIDVLGPPTIDGNPGYSTTGIVSGHGFAGATVTTLIGGATSGGCTSAVTAAGYWSCALPIGSGSYTVTARQSGADFGNNVSNQSGSLAVTIDKDPPASPAIVSPRSGARITGTQVEFFGTGETGGIADLYIDNVPACGVAIAGGAWRCAVGGISNGTHTALVIQRDAAGNYSQPSAPISLRFAAKAGTVVPVPPPAQTKPNDQPTTPDPPSTTPPGTPAPGTPAPSAPAPPAPPPAGPPSTWGTPTSFGATLPTLADTVSRGNWLLAPLLALAFILLIALPLRLLVTALRGRVRIPSLRLTGRNHERVVEPEQSIPMNPWLAGAVPLVVAAVLIVFSGGVNDEVRFLRLTAAVLLGLGLLNVVGVAIATRLGSRWQGISGRLRFLPVLMLAAVLAAALSRLTGIHPPVVAGVLIGIGFAAGFPARDRAVVSLVEVGSVTLLATLAWICHGWMPSVGFWGNLVNETLATVAIAGFGSVVILVLPIASLPGRVILEWSPLAWLATVAVVSVIGSVVILGGAGAQFPVLGSVLVAGAFALVSLAVWAWVRFVEPAPAPAET